MSGSRTARFASSGARARALCGVVVLVGVLAGCGADGPDAYTAPVDEAAPTTARTIPPTTMPPATGDGDAPPPTPPPVAPNGEVVEVRALDNTFRVADIEVVAGTEVLWINGGRNEHDVLPVDDTMDWGAAKEDFEPGAEYGYVFAQPGTYLYYCSIHGTSAVGMVGSVTVLPADG